MIRVSLPVAMYETILHFVNDAITLTSKSFIYLGIGSCPHEPLNQKTDQLIPCFVKDILQDKSSTLQIILIDPAFKNKYKFLQSYFADNLSHACHYEEDGLLIWQSERINVYIAPTKFLYPSLHTEDTTWFLHSLADLAIENQVQMIYQDYTGQDMNPLFQTLYTQYDKVHQIQLQNFVLFDVSYGTDTGCSTDLVKYKPFYQPDGFINLQLYTNDEVLKYINKNPALDSIILERAIQKYRTLLNDIHVDYRRKQNGTLICTNTTTNTYGYTETSSADDIMKCLQNELVSLVPQFVKLGVFTKKSVEKLNTYFQQTHTIDKYKWYELVMNLLKFDDASS